MSKKVQKGAIMETIMRNTNLKKTVTEMYVFPVWKTRNYKDINSQNYSFILFLFF